MDHQIHHQRIEISIRDAGEKDDVALRIRQLEETMMSNLEKVFDSFDVSGQVLRLDRLEINLGAIQLSQLEEVFCERFPTMVAEVLANPRNNMKISHAPHTAEDGLYRSEDRNVFYHKSNLSESERKSEFINTGRHQKKDSIKNVNVNVNDIAVEALLYFLNTGLRPWWSQRQDWDSLLQTASHVVKQQGGLVQLWKQVSAPADQVISRLAGNGAWPAVGKEIESFANRNTINTAVIANQWMSNLLLLSSYLVDRKFFNSKKLSCILLKILGQKNVQCILTNDRENEGRVKLNKTLSLLLEGSLEFSLSPDFKLDGAIFTPLSEDQQKINLKTILKSSDGQDPQLNGAVNDQLVEDSQTTEALTAFTPSAGLVLLAPFLESLFDAVGMTDEKGRFLEEGQHRAVGLLAFLVWGDVLPPEPDLVLEKWLCGLTALVPWRQNALSNFEKEQAEKVLSAALKHWSALKSTSNEGLRQNFLQRSGKLDDDASRPQLWVEKADWDILLDKVPWPINVVSLPWLKNPLLVDWR